MSRHALQASTRHRAWAAALCALVLVLAPGPRAQAEEADPEVVEAREALDEARALERALSSDLDAAAAAYENANAHHLRLQGESAGAASVADAARTQTAAAQRALAKRVAGIYKQPAVETRLFEAVLQAEDPGTALHRASLLGRIANRSVLVIQASQRLEALTLDTVRQQKVVTVGSAGAASDRQRLAEDLTLALQSASHQVSGAERSLEDAEEAAAERKRLEEEQERREAIAAAFQGVAPLPPVAGKVCPIGAPNGFIDSWGFPRSGGRQHQGADMFAAYGMPVYAVTEGTVRVGNNRLGGLSVHLHADDGDRYYYAHLSAASVTTGQRVRAGDVLGANGDSGNARGTPPHLHWQYHPGGGPPVNPYALATVLCR